MMLVAAKWREFCEVNPNLQGETNKEEEDFNEYQSKSTRPRSSRSEKVVHTNFREHQYEI